MVISNILIPTDFSPASWNATQFGLELSRQNHEVRLSLLHVYPVSNSRKQVVATPVLDGVKSRMNKLAKDLTSNPEIIKNVVLSGSVEKTLIDFIKENKFDLVIVGVNSNGSTNEIGSHTASLIEKSGTPVLVVPNNPSPYGAIAS
ncbi:MAG: universal stress protein [Ekhidna sp.]